jgi:hypothetical protein
MSEGESGREIGEGEDTNPTRKGDLDPLVLNSLHLSPSSLSFSLNFDLSHQ